MSVLCAGLTACSDGAAAGHETPQSLKTTSASAGPAGVKDAAVRTGEDLARDDAPFEDAPFEDAPFEYEDPAAEFSDVLAQYQALNRRLEGVALRLQRANAPLCPAVVRHPGYSVHTLSDYPKNLRAVARPLLGVDEGLSIRSVHAGSPADAAGLKPMDKLIGLNGQRFAGGKTQMQFYEQLSRRAFAREAASLTLARRLSNGEHRVFSAQITPETLCDYPAHVVFDPAVNGHTDGKAVWITSALMRSTKDDSALALITAHEMAHAISGHIQGRSSKALELQADRMALVMMRRAGFDIERAAAFWTRADSPQNRAQALSDTHPDVRERRENFKQAHRQIEAAQRAGEALDFRTVK
jgi:Zn-dependent protease with chaperone function